MDLEKRYHDVEAVLQTLDFDALFAGFHKYSFAIYNSKEICLDGKIIPYQESFRGNTATHYNGQYIAIWNLELDPVNDIEVFAYLLVHEMFHCHQMAHGEKRYPADLILLNYPGDIDNFEKKYNENLYLAESCENCDTEAFQKFAYIRNMRMKTYPDMVRQELLVETLEGTAEYVGLKALQKINRKKFDEIIKEYLCKLRQQDSLLFDMRRNSYYSGVLYYLCCDRNRMHVRNHFADEQTVYEQNPIAVDGKPVTIRHYAFIPALYTELIGERKKRIVECIEKWDYIACQSFICGYDPMNMFRVGTFIYCRYFVCLNKNGTIQTINTPVVLQLAENSNQDVIGYYCAK